MSMEEPTSITPPYPEKVITAAAAMAVILSNINYTEFQEN